VNLPEGLVGKKHTWYNTNLSTSADAPRFMALAPEQVATLLKLRALGWSQAEIAEKLEVSQQTVAYNLKKLKEQSKRLGPDEVFNKAMLAGLAGAAAGVGLVALLELFKNSKK
jgi:predicted transcriptional regulator